MICKTPAPTNLTDWGEVAVEGCTFSSGTEVIYQHPDIEHVDFVVDAATFAKLLDIKRDRTKLKI